MGLVGTVAWMVPWIHLAEALPAFLVITVASVVISARLRRGTTVLPAAAFPLAA